MVDVFLSLLAGMIAREELPQERDKSQPGANGPAAPADGTVVSPLLVRYPRRGTVEVADPAQTADASQPPPRCPARITRDILNNPPRVQTPARTADQPGEVAFAVRLTGRTADAPAGAPALKSMAPGQTPVPIAVRPDAAPMAASAPAEETLRAEHRGSAPPADASPARSSDESVGQPRETASFATPTRARDSRPSPNDAPPAAHIDETRAQAAAPGVQPLPHSATAPERGQRAEASLPVTPQKTETASAHPPTAKEITVRLAADDSPPVDIRVIDRAGAVRIAVRTTDTHLARSMQAGLSDLVNGLERRGFAAEAWSPTASAWGPHDRDPGAHRQYFEQGSGAFEHPGGGQHSRHGQGENGKPDARHRPQWVLELASSIGQPEKEYRT